MRKKGRRQEEEEEEEKEEEKEKEEEVKRGYYKRGKPAIKPTKNDCVIDFSLFHFHFFFFSWNIYKYQKKTLSKQQQYPSLTTTIRQQQKK